MMEPDPSFLDVLLLIAGVGCLYLFLFGPLLIFARVQNVPMISAVLCLVSVVLIPMFIVRIVSSSTKFDPEKVQ